MLGLSVSNDNMNWTVVAWSVFEAERDVNTFLCWHPVSCSFWFAVLDFCAVSGTLCVHCSCVVVFAVVVIFVLFFSQLFWRFSIKSICCVSLCVTAFIFRWSWIERHVPFDGTSEQQFRKVTDARGCYPININQFFNVNVQTCPKQGHARAFFFLPWEIYSEKGKKQPHFNRLSSREAPDPHVEIAGKINSGKLKHGPEQFIVPSLTEEVRSLKVTKVPASDLLVDLLKCSKWLIPKKGKWVRGLSVLF